MYAARTNSSPFKGEAGRGMGYSGQELPKLDCHCYPIPTPSRQCWALHSQPVRAAQSGALRNPVLTPLKGRERMRTIRGIMRQFSFPKAAVSSR